MKKIVFGLSVLAMSFSLQAKASKVTGIAQSLTEKVNAHGLEEVAKQPLTKLETQLLLMISDVMDNKKVSEDLKRELNRLPITKMTSKYKIAGDDYYAFYSDPTDHKSDMYVGPTVAMPRTLTTGIDKTKWIYSVTFNNNSNMELNEVVVFHQPYGQEGVTFLKVEKLGTSQGHIFKLGRCDQMKHYAIGVFFGDILLAKIPEHGNMTPELASIIKPEDVHPCMDSWKFVANIDIEDLR